MRITIFSLGTAWAVCDQHGASSRRTGDRLRAGCKSDLAEKNLTVIEGSLQNRERVLEALLEADAVISVLTPMRVKHVKKRRHRWLTETR